MVPVRIVREPSVRVDHIVGVLPDQRPSGSLGNRIPAHDELGLDRQFLRCQLQGFLGYRFGNAIRFEQDTTWLDYGSPVLRVTLTFTHPHFLWLLGNGLVREDTDPYIPFTLHTPVQSLTRTFQLPICHPTPFHSF